jgi:hypothetical protein
MMVEVEKEDNHGQEVEMFMVEEEKAIINGDVIIVVVNNILNAIVNCTRKKEGNYGVATVRHAVMMMVCVLTGFKL